MKGLVIYPKPDLTQHRDDYLDERYFQLLARRFQRAHPQATIHLEEFDEDDSREFFRDIAKTDYQGLDIFAYIGHGGQHNLYSANVGPRSKETLINTLRSACNDEATIIFYACNTGQLESSLLRDIYNRTVDKRFTLYGHSTIGRAGNNPNKTVFPPANGAMLIDVVLGDFARVRRFRTAWNQTFGNEADDLWATFFLLTNDELLRRVLKGPMERAAASNRRSMRTHGWESELPQIRQFLGVPNGSSDEELALAIAQWQMRRFQTMPNEVDGILGRTSWPALQAEMSRGPAGRSLSPAQVGG